MHLLHDVASTNELALDVDLWQGWPVAELLDSFSDALVLKAVDILVLIDSVELHDLHYVVTEAASRHLLVSLHEDHYVIFIDPLL